MRSTVLTIAASDQCGNGSRKGRKDNSIIQRAGRKSRSAPARHWFHQAIGNFLAKSSQFAILWKQALEYSAANYENSFFFSLDPLDDLVGALS